MTEAGALLKAFKRQLTGAQDLLEEVGVIGVYPVPLGPIIKYLGYKAVFFKRSPDTEDISGAVDHENEIIYINASESLGRNRFTLAHEIAHVRLHKGTSKIDYRKSIETSFDASEIQANQFAADLLMDALEVVKVWGNLQRDINKMANYFGVSRDAMKIRCKALGLM